MRIVLLGPPGSGKGTQGQLLARRYGIPEISTGELLRRAVADRTPLGKAAKTVMDAGQLVSDDIVLGIIQERLMQPDARKGFILDGFPRNLSQAEQLDELLEQLGQPIDVALLIELNVDAILQRLLGRRTCRSCGASYNIFSAPPKMEDSCDECGGRLKRRGDDNEETIGNRLRVYELQTLPVVERYREQGRLRVVQGLGDVDDVFRAVTKVIDEVRAAASSRDRSAAIRRAVARQQNARSEGAPGAADSKPAAGKGGKSKASAKPSAGSAAVKKKAAAKKKPAAVARSTKKAPLSARSASTGTAKKKAVTKKTLKKKAATSKKTAKKAPAKKTPAKKAPVKKAPVKKAATKKKVVAKKKTASAPARNKAASAKTAKKTAKKKTVARKVVAKKKVAVKKKAAPARKKAPASRKAARKAPVRKKVAAKKKTGRKR